MKRATPFTQDERRLLLSFLFFAIAWPVFSTFMNTFLWRTSQNVFTLIAFNVGIFAGLPLGFLLNFALLKRFRYTTLFLVGCVLQGVGPLLLTLIHPTSFAVIGALGACLGIPMGVYWGNRNLVTSGANNRRHRMAFLSMESVLNMLVGITVPVLIGMYLVNITSNVELGYLIITIVSFGILIIAGVLVGSITLKLPVLHLTSPWVKDVSVGWKSLRGLTFLDGAITASESILALLMIFTFLGMEDAVGSVRSGVAIIAAMMMYRFGSRIQRKDYVRVMMLTITLIGGGSVRSEER